ncbi:GNAT family N-acetyltransferase [Burkholderia stagnalis]|uniref:GNAT family N-acetyltransferase n=1 Tax=Burkholderia stagnalis TaxID=1503054 RepID=UPI000AB5681E|nr:GNAT family N-acetyltransferase [Burkholderia stagnalis]
MTPSSTRPARLDVAARTRPVDVRAAAFPDDEELVQDLLLEYEMTWLRHGVTMPRLGTELTALPGPYAPPHGAVYIARLDGAPVGCAAVAACDGPPGRREIRRLYVRDGAHASDVLGALLARVAALAELDGCSAVRCAIFADLDPRAATFARHGFNVCAPDGPPPDGMRVPPAIRIATLEKACVPTRAAHWRTLMRRLIVRGQPGRT